ncbi:MAG: dihydropteroate synthase [Coriobacteriales bacterium]|nr:dihydropteroate synthase [Coriobacteriales bacterium]
MWHCGKHRLSTERPLIMGILNVTPDSFSDGGNYTEPRVALAHAREMLAAGAQIIDVGGESTRPGSAETAVGEELRRVLPVVRSLVEDGAVVSIDTRHAEVAAAALEAGAGILNDITGFTQEGMRALAEQSDAGLVVMHMQGEPREMQTNPHYNDVVAEVGEWLDARAGELTARGVAAERICLDVGPGFGKTFEHNLALLKGTAAMAQHAAEQGFLWMAAWSRKGFIGTLTGEEVAARRVAGSVAVACYAAACGANVVRVHDVGATAQALRVLMALS